MSSHLHVITVKVMHTRCAVWVEGSELGEYSPRW